MKKIKGKPTANNQKVFCPTGPGGGIDPTCSPVGFGASTAKYSPPKKNDKGQIIAGTAGGYAGINTSSWQTGATNPDWAMKKIAKLEEYAAAGDWVKFKKKMSFPITDWKKLPKFHKAIVVAQQNLLNKHGKQISELPGQFQKAVQKNLDNNPGLMAKLQEMAAYDANTIAMESGGKGPAVPATASELKKTFWNDLEVIDGSQGWTKTGGKLGTEEGYQAEHEGQKYYIKVPESQARLRNEITTNQLYQLAGAKVSEANYILTEDGKLGMANKWVDGAKKADWDDHSVKDAASQDYAAHVWLNNRDAIGAGSENPMMNIVQDANGQLNIIDVGGGLNYKGMGGAGTKEFGPNAGSEWHSMVSAKNPSMAKVFKGISPLQQIQSLNKLESITHEDIDAIIDANYKTFPVHKKYIADRLKSRLASLKDINASLKSSYPEAAKLASGMETQNPPTKAAPPTKAKAAEKQKIKISTKGFPDKPSFVSKNEAQVQQNKDQLASIDKLAKAGTIHEIKANVLNGVYKSPKVASYATEVANNVHKQLNPPPPPKKYEGKLSDVANKITAKAVDAAHSVGYWNVLAKVDYSADDVPVGHSVHSVEFHEQGKKAYEKLTGHKKALKAYTNSPYKEMNISLRKGEPSKIAMQAATGMMKAPELPVGAKLYRRHNTDSSFDVGDIQPGTVVSDRGLLSTGTEPVWSGTVQWNMVAGPGVRGLPMRQVSQHKTEWEVILPPAQRIMAISKPTKKSDGRYHIDAVILPTDDAQCCPP
jgi:hypothetical protein